MQKIISKIILISLILFGFYISYILYSEVEEKTIIRQFEQQEIYAKQAAMSIENFFVHYNHSLDYLAKKDDIIAFNGNSRTHLKNYFEAQIDELKAITRISKEGKIIYTYPLVEGVIGKDVSDQPHNAEIIKTHKPVLSDVFTTVQGYSAIVYAYPVFKNNQYDGCVSLVIPFEYIANKFIRNIRFRQSGTSFLISEAGKELYCFAKDHVGVSIEEKTRRFDDFNKMIKLMLDKKEGRAKYSFYRNELDGEIVNKIAVFKPIVLENTFWSIAVVISEEEVLEANRGFIRKFLILLALMSIGVIIFIYTFAKERKKTRKIIRDKELKYKDNLEKLVELRTEELKKLNKSLQKDIHKRKKIEQELKHAIERVEKSEKIKSEFLAQMSHEIRTPINTILSFSSLIKEELSHYADEELNYGFSGIQSAGKRLIRTIDLILNMSDVQLGTHEYIPKETDICKDIIDNLLIEYRAPLLEKNIKFKLIKNTVHTKIVVDTYSVNQIFANLIDNAIKYTLEGEIIITCDRNSNGQLFLSIEDTGVGITEEYIPRLFDEFSQEDMGYTRKFEGNGLGLALVKKYCEINEAEIKVESEKDVGSKFTVIFKK